MGRVIEVLGNIGKAIRRRIRPQNTPEQEHAYDLVILKLRYEALKAKYGTIETIERLKSELLKSGGSEGDKLASTHQLNQMRGLLERIARAEEAIRKGRKGK